MDTHAAIVQTIAYFNLFDYPLTSLEVYKWLYQKKSKYSDVLFALQELTDDGQLVERDGFYCLVGREEIVAIRLSRYVLAEKKYRIALRAAQFIQLVPFITFVGVCNNVGFNNGSEKSDIDFFIVAKAGRLWLARLLVTIVVSILGIRRHKELITDRVCLSFYVADTHLDLRDIALRPLDVYLLYWLATLWPLYDRAGVYRQLLDQNAALLSHLPNFYHNSPSPRRSIAPTAAGQGIQRMSELLLAPFVAGLERITKQLQLRKMQHNTTSVAAEANTKVVISDVRLKFHETDRRALYYEQWQLTLKS